MPDEMLSIAADPATKRIVLIDPHTFVRECVAQCLRMFYEDAVVVSFTTIDECVDQDIGPRDVAFVDDWIYHTPYSSCHNIRIVYWAKVIGGTLRDEVDGSTDRCKYFRLARAAQIDLVDLAQLGVDAVRSRSSGFH